MNRSHWSQGLAATVVVSLLTIGCSSSTGGGSPSPTSSPTPTPAPSPTARVLPDDSVVDPGTYILGPEALIGLPTLRITFTVPGKDWSSWSTYGVSKAGGHSSVGMGILRVSNVYVDPCHLRLGEITPPVGPTVDDLARALARQPGIRATGPTDVTVSGFAGKFVELTIDPATDFATCENRFNAGWIGSDGDSVPILEKGQVTRYSIVEAYGARVVIFSALSPAAPAQDRVELQQLIDSIRIER